MKWELTKEGRVVVPQEVREWMLSKPWRIWRAIYRDGGICTAYTYWRDNAVLTVRRDTWIALAALWRIRNCLKHKRTARKMKRKGRG